MGVTSDGKVVLGPEGDNWDGEQLVAHLMPHQMPTNGRASTDGLSHQGTLLGQGGVDGRGFVRTHNGGAALLDGLGCTQPSTTLPDLARGVGSE